MPKRKPSPSFPAPKPGRPPRAPRPPGPIACPRCGTVHEGAALSCPDCLRKLTEAAARLRASRLAAGLCVNCGLCPPAEGKTLCDRCRAKRSKTQPPATRHRYNRTIAAGRCPRCGKERDSAATICCSSCLVDRIEARRRVAEDRKTAGLCSRCGKLPPAEGKTFCSPCRDELAAISARRAEKRRAAK